MLYTVIMTVTDVIACIILFCSFIYDVIILIIIIIISYNYDAIYIIIYSDQIFTENLK